MNPQQLQQLDWTPCFLSIPRSDALVRFKNELDGRQWTGRWNELSPAFNVAYIWWKLTGIERYAEKETV